MPGTESAFTRVFDALWPGMTLLGLGFLSSIVLAEHVHAQSVEEFYRGKSISRSASIPVAATTSTGACCRAT
jgi:hypothetical protein